MPDDLCKTCGNPKSSSSGSMSSYVRLCNCDLKLESDDSRTIQLCKKCGKRVGKGRDGSITQFIFRSDTCSCDLPEIVDNSNITDDKPIVYEEFVDSYEEEKEVELDLSSKQFPVGRYKPIKLLGKGGFSSVYLARDILLNKKVAIKVLHIVDSQLLIMFQDEAKATSKLKHKNIIEILDFGATEEGAPFMVLEYFPGITADEFLLVNGAFKWQQAVILVKHIAQALKHAHNQRIFHRDLKPSNILIDLEKDDQLEVKLIDFGIASIQEATSKITHYQGKTIAGTPNYMSPDVISGNSYSPASEIYSLGCVLYELLTGKCVFQGETALEILAQHSNRPPASVLEIGEHEIPRQLDAIVQKCLSKNPKDRYQTMNQLLESLDSDLTDDAKDSRTPINSLRKRKPLLLQLGLALLVISLLVFVPLKNHFALKNRTENSSLNEKNYSKQSFAKHLFPQTEMRLNKLSLSKEIKFRKTILGTNQKEHWAARIPRRVTDTDLLFFKTKTNIVNSIDLIDAPITDHGVESLLNLDLNFLKLEGTLITDKCSRSIRNFKNLINLSVTDTKFGDDGFKQLDNKRLVKIGAAHCPKLTNKGFKIIVEKWPNLVSLDLSFNKISSKGLLEIGKLKQLKTISISGMPISNELAIIISHSSIDHINMALAQTTRENLDKIASSPKLKSISAMKTIPNLKQWIKETNKKYPKLRVFNTANMDKKKLPPVNELHQFSDFIAPPDLTSN